MEPRASAELACSAACSARSKRNFILSLSIGPNYDHASGRHFDLPQPRAWTESATGEESQRALRLVNGLNQTSGFGGNTGEK
jgi:hypothetical protein